MASFSLTQATDNIVFTTHNSGTVNKDKGEFSISVTFEADTWTWKEPRKPSP